MNDARRGAFVRGFTLIELAVTLLIVTLLVGGVMMPLQAQVESRKVEETQKILADAREALLAYAASTGRFPCPADAVSNGREPATANPANGACPSYFGFFPAALLGFAPVDADGYAVDSWGGGATNRIRYAVSNHTSAGNQIFTMTGGMGNVGIPALASNNNLLHICGGGAGVNPGVDCGTAGTLATNVVAVIWSPGPNAAGGGATVHEAENPNPNGGSEDRLFVQKVRATSGAGEFDDQLTWISGFLAVSRLLASGQLP